MDVNNCISASENRLYESREYLAKEGYFHRFPGAVSTALYWAMEAWLMAYGYKKTFGKGWAGTRMDFWENAPKKLRSDVIYCLSETSFLQYDLEGGMDFKEQVPPISELKKRACECLEKAEKAVNQVLDSIRNKSQN